MDKPFISADENLPELTTKAVVLACILAAVLAASNAYLGLKVGWIISASIPAAVVAMVLFRFAKNSNILENNMVQTGASASATIANGIVFVLPALLIIKFWPKINYWESVFICIAGGIMGVLFSVPLRRAVLSHKELRYPEGIAIAEVLKINEGSTSLKDLFIAALVGAFVQLCQQGFALMASTYQIWFATNRAIFGFGMGFDITMIGAGYIIGFNVGLSILIGTIVGWIFGIPFITSLQGVPANLHSLTDVGNYVTSLWSSNLRYIGIGAMFVGGLWSLFICLGPIVSSLKFSLDMSKNPYKAEDLPRTERDIPLKYVVLGMVILLFLIGYYLYYQLIAMNLGLSTWANWFFFISTLIYMIVAGFIFSAITAYFSGLVGVSASPVSAVNLAVLIIISLFLSGLLTIGGMHRATASVILHASAISIMITAILACASSMSNGTIQDLKTGEILGATPWKLQVVLIIGVIVSTLVVPPVIGLLFNAYGIGNVFPRAGMNPATVLGAPQASLIAAVAQGVFFHNLPFKLIGIGAALSAGFIVFNQFLKRYGQTLSVVAFGLGMYLPMTFTLPIIIGTLVPLFISVKHQKQFLKGITTVDKQTENNHRTMLIACGLVAGGSLMGLLVSIPFAIKGNTEVLNLVPANFTPIAVIISIITTVLVCYWMYRRATKVA